jgi:hypothetical protein
LRTFPHHADLFYDKITAQRKYPFSKTVGGSLNGKDEED